MDMHRIIASLAVIAALGFMTAPASALTRKECSAKYQAAKTAGTLNGMSWNDFRKAQCGSDAAAAAPAAETKTAPATDQAAAVDTATPAPAVKKSRAKKMPPTRTTGEGPIFPNAIDQKYASESAGKGRMHTCLDQYRANKDNNGNAGLKWIQKGGGYYSECNKRLKG
jgi:hypothetical protein